MNWRKKLRNRSVWNAEVSFSTDSATSNARVPSAWRMLEKPSASPPGPANKSTTANCGCIFCSKPFEPYSNELGLAPGKGEMIDVVDKITRSRMMAGIRGKNTKPELDLRSALHRRGLRYRLHVADLPGRPDILLPRHRAAIQIHGCFWHRHEHCLFCTSPASNMQFWKSKFGDTIRRDKSNLKKLRKLGWRVAVVWECAVKEKGAEVIAARITDWLDSGRWFVELSSRQANAARRAKLSKVSGRLTVSRIR